jgi:hypothetical protein
MASQIDELEASIRELEAQIATAGAEMRPLLEKQIEALRSTIKMLAAAQPAMEQAKLSRRPLSDEIVSFFRPEPPADVPAWLADDITHAAVTESMMRCPAGARVYWNEASIACAVPGVPGELLSSAQGLSLQFKADGRLASQQFFERGCLRWSIDYHLTGGRSSSGFYASTEPKTYIEHGLHTRWAPSGTIVHQAHYIAGKKHGWEKHWEDDGYPIVATKWADGREVETVNPLRTSISS